MNTKVSNRKRSSGREPTYNTASPPGPSLPNEPLSGSLCLPPEYAPRDVRAFIDEMELLRRIPVSRRTIFNWRQAGKIPFVAIGKRIIFHWETVERAILRMQKGDA